MAETAPELLRAAAAALRHHESATLVPAVTPALRLVQGYALELLAFLIRERQGPETILGKLVAQARLPSDAGLSALLAEDPAARGRMLVPRLTDPEVPEGKGVDDPATLGAVLAVIDPKSTPLILRAAAEVLAAQRDAFILPSLVRVAATGGPPQREAVDAILLARASPEATALLAERIRREREPSLAIALLMRTRDRHEPEIRAAASTRLGPDEDLRVVDNAVSSVMGVADPALAPRYLAIIRRASSAAEGQGERGGVPPTVSDLEPGGALSREVEASLSVKVRQHALEALVTLPDPAAAEGLRELAADSRLTPSFRVTTIGSLGERGRREDLGFLESLARGDDRELRNAAKEAMHLIAPELHGEWDALGRYPLVVSSSVFGATLVAMFALSSLTRVGRIAFAHANAPPETSRRSVGRRSAVGRRHILAVHDEHRRVARGCRRLHDPRCLGDALRVFVGARRGSGHSGQDRPSLGGDWRRAPGHDSRCLERACLQVLVG